MTTGTGIDPSPRMRWLPPAAALALLLAACGKPPGPAQPAANAACEQARTPEAAVTLVVDALRDDSLDAIPCRALPPALQARMELAWREDRSRWPIAELPLSSKLPAILAALNAPAAGTKLRIAFDLAYRF